MSSQRTASPAYWPWMLTLGLQLSGVMPVGSARPAGEQLPESHPQLLPCGDENAASTCPWPDASLLQTVARKGASNLSSAHARAGAATPKDGPAGRPMSAPPAAAHEPDEEEGDGRGSNVFSSLVALLSVGPLHARHQTSTCNAELYFAVVLIMCCCLLCASVWSNTTLGKPSSKDAECSTEDQGAPPMATGAERSTSVVDESNAKPCASAPSGLSRLSGPAPSAKVPMLNLPEPKAPPAAPKSRSSLALRRTSEVPHAFAADGTRHLCPRLVVPKSRQCTLSVPRLLAPAHLVPGSVYRIHDTGAASVLIVSVTQEGDCFQPRAEAEADARGDATRKLVLTSAADQTEFGFVQRCAGSPRDRMVICTPSGHAFGCVVSRSGGYSFQGESTMSAFYSKGSSRCVATDRDGNLLAIVEQRSGNDGNKYQSVLVGPLVDAGFLVLFLTAIDWLDILGQDGAPGA